MLVKTKGDFTMIYKVVPGPQAIAIKGNDLSSATNTYADIINREAVDGWVFHSIEPITVNQSNGCALNKQVSTYAIYMIIFCKEA